MSSLHNMCLPFLPWKANKKESLALASVAQWTEWRPANTKVTSSIPSQGTCLGCGPGPQWGVLERQPHIDVSLALSSSLPLSLNKIFSPGWCCSVDWVLPWEPKGADSIPGQGICLSCTPGPKCRACEKQCTLMFLSLSLSFPLCQKINK